MAVITTLEKFRELRREVQLRKNTYARLINSGRMSTNEAERRIKIMEAVRDDYEQRLIQERQERNHKSPK